MDIEYVIGAVASVTSSFAFGKKKGRVWEQI